MWVLPPHIPSTHKIPANQALLINRSFNTSKYIVQLLFVEKKSLYASKICVVANWILFALIHNFTLKYLTMKNCHA